MNRNGDVEAEGVVVHDVDGEEKDDIGHPADQGDPVRDKEERGVMPREVRIIAMDRDQQELRKGYENA
jgi:hypothetical protein